MDAKTPGIAKQRGRKVTLRPNWDYVERFKAMRSVLGAKFLSDHEMTTKLLETGNAYLEEGNTWHDTIWGVCLCNRSACTQVGANSLGTMLMELRSDIRKWM